jgi:multidrug efflux pump subunit AcrA (membrane-fusion protein)
MNANVDLRQLAVQRDTPPEPARRRRTQILTRYLLPGGVLLGFAAVFAWAFRDSFLTSRPVTVVPVLTARAETHQSGAPLFHAAGWVEARPTPVLVAALAEGIVEKLLVVEGQEVKAGQPVAQLIDADARLAVRAVEAELEMRKAERDAALADVDILLAQKETELADLPFQRRATVARAQLALQDFEGKSKAPGAVSEIALRAADRELESANAGVDQLKTRELRLKREVETLTAKRKTNLQVAEARLEQARVALETANLRLKRMVVTAPISGRVLGLIARPGMRLMGFTAGSPQDASSVVSLYDPASLQVRADVRFEDLPRVLPGQPVSIETPAVAGKLEGVVLRLTSQANIQKNTLEVKVSIKDPPSVLGADMLVQATFLALPSAETRPPETDSLRLFVPRQLVEVGEQGSTTWIADQAAGVARRRPIKLGQEAAGGLVEVTEGLTPADKLISGGHEGLRDGQRVAVTGEDTTLGLAAPEKSTKANRPARLQEGDRGQPKKP